MLVQINEGPISTKGDNYWYFDYRSESKKLQRIHNMFYGKDLQRCCGWILFLWWGTLLAFAGKNMLNLLLKNDLSSKEMGIFALGVMLLGLVVWGAIVGVNRFLVGAKPKQTVSKS